MQKLLYAIDWVQNDEKNKSKGNREWERRNTKYLRNTLVFIIINIRVYREYENEISLKYHKVYRTTIRNLKILTNEQTNIRIKYI